MLLYNSPISGNCYKVRLLLAHLGIPYETRFVDAVDRTLSRDELAGLSPSRRVPTLVLDDGRPLAESNAIVWYLGEGTRFVPGDAYARAQMLQWMFWEQYDHEPAIAVLRFLKTYSGRPELVRGPARPPAQARRQGARRDGAPPRRARWFAGDAMSLADIVLYAYTHAAGEGGFELEPYPAVRAWVERVAAEPGHVTIDA